MIPGYIVIKPNFPECIDDFGFLWFEDEYIDVAARWILAANAANALAEYETRRGRNRRAGLPFLVLSVRIGH